MNGRLLAVDLHNQIYRACHAHKQLSHRGIFTGGLYGFLQSVTKAIELTGATHLLVCRDSKPYVRSRQYPEYKLLRKGSADPELKEMFDDTLPLLEQMFDQMGILTWAIPGYECDDLIADAAIRLRHRMEILCAMCNDSDLWPLFEMPHFRMYKDAKHPMIGYKDTLGKSGVSGDEYRLCSALAGTHNDIEGIPGVGMTTALKIIRDPAKLRAIRATWGPVIDRNLELIRLPHAQMPRESIPFLSQRGARDHTRILYRFCARFDIQPFPWWVSAFDQVL